MIVATTIWAPDGTRPPPVLSNTSGRLNTPDIDHRRDGQQERERGRGLAGQAEEQADADGAAGPGHAGDQRQRLGQAHGDRVRHR